METDSFNINMLKEQTIEKLEKIFLGCKFTKFFDEVNRTGFNLIYINEKNWVSFSVSFHSHDTPWSLEIYFGFNSLSQFTKTIIQTDIGYDFYHKDNIKISLTGLQLKYNNIFQLYYYNHENYNSIMNQATDDIPKIYDKISELNEDSFKKLNNEIIGLLRNYHKSKKDARNVI